MRTPRLIHRQLQPEWMDQPGLAPQEHHRALRGLGRLNTATGIARQLWRQIKSHLCLRSIRRITVLDVASGGGDVPFALWRRARRAGVDLTVLGLDVSPVACEYAAFRCRAAKEAIRFEPSDVTRAHLPYGFDVAICSLFLHHLQPEQVVELIARMSRAARLIVVSDLRRCTSGYLLAQAACRLATSSPVVHADGPQSVLNAFTLTEMRRLFEAAGLPPASVRPAWPCRIMAVHKRDGS